MGLTNWSVSIYRGPSPLALAPDPSIAHPALASRQITDMRCTAVADPFLHRRDGTWHLFVEVVNTDLTPARGEIALATSRDLREWQYQGVVLREPFHLSYPYVFEWDGQVYMLPETRQASSIRLYVADEFPHRWRFVRSLAEGLYADPSIVRRGGRWWLFVQRGLDELQLFSSAALDEPFAPHPKSPITVGNRRIARPAGRIIEFDGRLVRFAQDAWPSYGSRVRALEIDRLSLDDYAEHEVEESPVLEASSRGWNSMAMHHLDLHRLESGEWIAAVDGASVSW